MNCLVDTNVLGRIVQKNHSMHPDAVKAVRILKRQKETLCILPQNLIELWVVATRPLDVNGFGLTIDEANKELRRFKKLFRLQLDTPSLFVEWEKLVNQYQVMGKPAHDARIISAMKTHSLTHLLTFNVDDFKRYKDIVTVVSPQEVIANGSI